MFNGVLRCCGVAVSLCLIASCQSAKNTILKEQISSQETAAEARSIELWPKLQSVVPKDELLEGRIEQLLVSMSKAEKVGQLIQPEIKFATPADVRKYHLGSVLNGGGTAPNNNKYSSPADWVEMTNEYYKAAMDTSDGGVAIPIIWGSDAVHGHNNVLGSTLFPHNIGLGAARDPGLIRRIGFATAKEVAVTGVDWTFAPTVAVARDDRWGRTYESYSEDPEIVREYSQMMVEGLQGRVGTTDFLDESHVVATAKHFLADGGTLRGIDRGDAKISEQELVSLHAAGFISALEAGSQTIMASFNSWNGEKLHGSRYLLTDVLKGRMGFDGLVVGDWNAHRFVDGCAVDSCPSAINAGLDMLMTPSDWKPLYENTLSQVKSGEIPMSRVDDAVRRILRVKLRAGLFDKGPVTGRLMAGRAGVMGGKQHRALAREAVRKSLVLLKNNNRTLPLNPKANILVVGEAANSISRQSGGWTLSWQGTGNKREDFKDATTIFEGIALQASIAGGQALYSEQGDSSKISFKNGKSADAVVFVYGEHPYAEWHGDIAGIEYQLGEKSDLKILNRLAELEAPIVSVFLSGRPLWVNKEINKSDAFVAAWLPGSEGVGVADVILKDGEGNFQYDFQGTLSFSWPKYAHQTVINLGDKDYSPLFSYGYGLNYEDDKKISSDLNEDSISFVSGELDDAWVLVSRTMPPWTLNIKENGKKIPVEGNHGVSGIDSNVTVISIDRVSQEDARTISWAGLREGAISFDSNNGQDFIRYVEEGSVLSFEVRVDQEFSDKLMLTMDCGAGCEAKLVVNSLLQVNRSNEWNLLNLDLKCLAEKGVDFGNVNSVFGLSTYGKGTISLSNIKIIPKLNEGLSSLCVP